MELPRGSCRSACRSSSEESNPELAIRSLAWQAGLELCGRGNEDGRAASEIYGAKDELERISFGAIASVDLFRATGEQRYADEAFKLGDRILASQEQTIQPWRVPLTGFFYTGPKRENLFIAFI